MFSSAHRAQWFTRFSHVIPYSMSSMTARWRASSLRKCRSDRLTVTLSRCRRAPCLRESLGADRRRHHAGFPRVLARVDEPPGIEEIRPRFPAALYGAGFRPVELMTGETEDKVPGSLFRKRPCPAAESHILLACHRGRFSFFAPAKLIAMSAPTSRA